MSDLYDTIVSDPCLYFKGKPAVMYRGHKMMPSTAQRMKELRPHVIEMSKKGLSIRDGAVRLGYSKAALVNFIKIMGVVWPKVRRNGARPKLDKTGWWELIHKAAEQGDTLETLGERIGVHPMNLHRYCKTHGIAWKQIRTYGKQTLRNR
jgi:methylphosphotriester-DNA--protein-cysteine methyltransferase